MNDEERAALLLSYLETLRKMHEGMFNVLDEIKEVTTELHSILIRPPQSGTDR